MCLRLILVCWDSAPIPVSLMEVVLVKGNTSQYDLVVSEQNYFSFVVSKVCLILEACITVKTLVHFSIYSLEFTTLILLVPFLR